MKNNLTVFNVKETLKYSGLRRKLLQIPELLNIPDPPKKLNIPGRGRKLLNIPKKKTLK